MVYVIHVTHLQQNDAYFHPFDDNLLHHEQLIFVDSLHKALPEIQVTYHC